MPCECLSKTVLKVFNGIFLLGGLAYIGLGIYVLVDEDFDWAGKDYAYGCFVFGGFIVLLSAFGLCGTGSRCMIWIYAIIMTLILLAELAVFILALTQGTKLKEWLSDGWDEMSAEDKTDFMEKAKCGLNNEDNPLNNCTKVIDVDPCFEDCYTKVENDFKTAGSVLMIVTCSVVGVQTLLLTASCCLVCDDDFDEEKF